MQPLRGSVPAPSLMEHLRKPETPPAWPLTTALFLVAAYAILIIAGQAFAVTLTGDTFSSPQPSAIALGAVLGGLATIAVVFQWARRRTGQRWIEDLRLMQPPQPPVTLVALFGLGAAWAMDLVGVLLGLKGNQILPPLLDVLRNPLGGPWIVGALLALVVQPVAEALVFAGVLYPALARDLRNNLLAAVATALVYVGINVVVLATNTGAWYAVLQPLLMMLAVVLARAYTGSTQSAAVARAFFGLFFVLAALVSMRG